ncbi:class I SAM-dependent methyltransferase [Staphylococcus hyicus]|uniref:class I SAM-dependent methyltransferase n=1 Tax=Staphylococcus hyicus TaxID=1284 RepID=UPI0027382DB4|nr:class I SAM-dependent methyltransferase [Staphylococcus hyicus]MDP4448159.1 class I SAM-dependent methyltransferase [Staphylococcus hyicus]MDP4468514.1 class I SAM-dependent methyltransferase [Staphylococcus hyicus]
MTQSTSVMEQLFKKLDDTTKQLNEENGQSFIENLGLSMEQIYTKERDLLEQATLQDRRKAFQFAYLSQLQKEEVQANHQITPDSIGLILGYLISQFESEAKALHIADLGSGAGHLSATVHEVMSEKTLMHHLVEVDPVLSRLSVHLANFLEIPFDVYPQDALMPLSFEEADVIIGDLPIGYYPVDERSHEMKLGFKEGHSYAHHLFIEQSITALKPSGYAFLVVPSTLFDGNQVKQLQNFIATETVMQAFLHLPRNLFKNKRAQKSLLVLQKKAQGITQPVEVLLATIPDLKQPQNFQNFLRELNEWMQKNHPQK